MRLFAKRNRVKPYDGNRVVAMFYQNKKQAASTKLQFTFSHYYYRQYCTYGASNAFIRQAENPLQSHAAIFADHTINLVMHVIRNS